MDDLQQYITLQQKIEELHAKRSEGAIPGYHHFEIVICDEIAFGYGPDHGFEFIVLN